MHFISVVLAASIAGMSITTAHPSSNFTIRADDVSEQASPKKPATPPPGLGLDDCYWEGHWPICVSKCGYGYKKVKLDRCGEGHCCWFGQKTLCCVIPSQKLGDKPLEDHNDDGNK